jgi:alanine dehydrogenase
MKKETYIVEDSSKIVENTPYEGLVPKIEGAFSSYYKGEVEMPDKSYVDIEEYNGDFRSMPAYVRADDWEASGVKWVNVHPNNEILPTVMGTVVLTDPQNGFPMSIMNGTEITGRRTGAVAAVATDYLAIDDAKTLGIVGAGAQSYEQVNAISTVRDIETIVVSDINSELEDEFVEYFDDEYTVIPGNINDISNCDVISTVTPSTSPILKDVKDGAHINAMGADAPQKQELSVKLISQDDVSLIVDDMSQAVHSGEVSKSVQDGVVSQNEIDTLGAVIQSNGSLESEKTVFDSTGLAIQDIATAHLVYDSIDKENLLSVNLR